MKFKYQFPKWLSYKLAGIVSCSGLVIHVHDKLFIPVDKGNGCGHFKFWTRSLSFVPYVTTAAMHEGPQIFTSCTQKSYISLAAFSVLLFVLYYGKNHISADWLQVLLRLTEQKCPCWVLIWIWFSLMKATPWIITNMPAFKCITKIKKYKIRILPLFLLGNQVDSLSSFQAAGYDFIQR